MDISIIIVSYNVCALLRQCIASVEEAGRDLAYEIIVVDNNSGDDTAQYFRDKQTPATFIWNKENLGFARANNLGVAIAKGKNILFLNPDTIITRDCLRQCIAHIEATENCGVVGVHMIDGMANYLPESKRSLPGILGSFFYFSGISKFFEHSSYFNAYHSGNIDKNSRSEVQVISGAFMMADAGLIKKVGGFDASYFMYGEDIDLSITIEELGYKNWYLGDVKILHYKGESCIKKDENYYKVFFSAMKLFAKKHNDYLSGKIKSLFIDGTEALFKLKYRISKNSKEEKHLPYHLTSAYCTADEETTLNLFNKKYAFADKLLFYNKVPSNFIPTTVIIYSTALMNYSSIIEQIAKSDSPDSKFIFDAKAGTLIGSNGKAKSAIIYKL